MATEYVYLGSAPANEKCVDLGWKATGEDWDAAKKEMRRYIELLNKMFHPLTVQLNINPVFVIKKENGDDYAEVALRYDGDDSVACQFAYFVDACAPGSWDEYHVYSKAEFDSDMLGDGEDCDLD